MNNQKLEKPHNSEFLERYAESSFEMVPCAIYIRVSTEEQAKEDRYSLAAQEEYCMGEIRKRQAEGWVHRITISDPGYSGKSFERPGLLKLIAMAKAGEIRAIVVYKRDRLFRDADIAAQVQAIFDLHGVRVLSYSEGMRDGTPHAVLMRQFIDANSQFERAQIRTRINDCMRHAAKRGDWKGGTSPYGYRYTPGEKVLRIDPDEAPIVKLIFQRIAAGDTAIQVVEYLRELNIYCRPQKKRIIGR